MEHNQTTLAQIQAQGGELFFDQEQNMLIFKFPDLYQLIHRDHKISYPSFRKMVYQSNINEELRKLGAKIEIHQSTGKVDENVYRLVKL